MPRISRSARLLQNAEAALISSIEIYNKPVFAYREETFAIPALNAWELLVKSKLLLQNRYIDFKGNAKYHELRKKLALNPQYKKTRYLDPANTSGLRKDFFNPNIVAEFDKSYTRKK